MRSFQEILPEIVQQTHSVEAERKKCLATRKQGYKLLTGIGLATIVLVVILASQIPVAAIIAAVSAVVAMICIHSSFIQGPFQEFRKHFKSSFIEPSLRAIVDDVRYSPAGNEMIFLEYQASELFPHQVDRRRFEDSIFGRVGETDVKFSEMHTEYKTTTTNNKGQRTTHWHTIFKGLFISADFHKDFQGSTFVRSDVAEKTFGRFGRMLQKPVFSSLELVQLEDPEFEKQFVVHASDQVESRYILTPSLMERMLTLKSRFGSEVVFSFLRSRVFIAVSTPSDFFEPDLQQTLYNHEYLRNYVEQIHLCLGVVEDLGLNVRIWSKQ